MYNLLGWWTVDRHEMEETERNYIKFTTFCPPVRMLAGFTWTHDMARVKKSECRNSISSTQKKVTYGWDSLRDVKKSEHELFDSFRFLLSLRPTFLEGRDAGGLRSCQRLRKPDQSMTTIQRLQSLLVGIWSRQILTLSDGMNSLRSPVYKMSQFFRMMIMRESTLFALFLLAYHFNQIVSAAHPDTVKKRSMHHRLLIGLVASTCFLTTLRQWWKF